MECEGKGAVASVRMCLRSEVWCHAAPMAHPICRWQLVAARLPRWGVLTWRDGRAAMSSLPYHVAASPLHAWTRFTSESARLGNEHGQASVEAAALLPVLMLLVALLAQPVCLLYTRMVMRHVAAETARVLLTTDSWDRARTYARHALGAVPEASLFHAGGIDDWCIRLDRDGIGSSVTVGIEGHVRPLPLLGVVAELMGEHDERGVRVRAQVTERMRPEWLGGDYETWIAQWGI